MSDDLFRIDLVDEASAESFPASDPPSFTGLRLGAPSHEDAAQGEPIEPERERHLRRAIFFASGAVLALAALWMLRRRYWFAA